MLCNNSEACHQERNAILPLPSKANESSPLEKLNVMASPIGSGSEVGSASFLCMLDLRERPAVASLSVQHWALSFACTFLWRTNQALCSHSLASLCPIAVHKHSPFLHSCQLSMVASRASQRSVSTPWSGNSKSSSWQN